MSKERRATIAKKFGFQRMAAHRTMKRYHELGTAEDRPRSGRPRSVNTSRVGKIVKKSIVRDNQRSMRKMASGLSISPASVRKIVKHVLEFHPYNICRTHMLTENMKASRYEKAKKLLNVVW